MDLDVDERHESTVDARFLNAAAMLGMTVLEASHRATTFGSDIEVRRLAEQVLIGFKQIDEELRFFAEGLGIDMPEQLDEPQRMHLGWLYQLSGKSFDQAYASKVGIEAQLEMMRLFEHELAAGAEQPVREWAGRRLSDMRNYLHMARRLHFAPRKQ